MGGRSSPKTQYFVRSRKKVKTIKETMKNKTSEVAAKVIFAVVATETPFLAAAYASYRVANFLYPIVEKGVDEYERTKDTDNALDKMKEETIKQTGKEILGRTAGHLVGIGIEKINRAGIETDEQTNTAIKTAVSETIKEAIS